MATMLLLAATSCSPDEPTASPASEPATGLPTPAATAGPEPRPSPPHDGESPAPPGTAPAVLLTVGDADTLNRSEHELVDHLASRRYAVTVSDDDGPLARLARAHDLVIVSKTVESTTVGERLPATITAGLLTWEDNLQMTGLLGLVTEDGSDGTAWHATGDTITVTAAAPRPLRAGLSGPVTLYDQPGEITYGPSVGRAATVVARTPAGRPAYYVYDTGDRLADGSQAAGRRVYFPLYDDTFATLTAEGRMLFDAATDWAAERTTPQ